MVLQKCELFIVKFFEFVTYTKTAEIIDTELQTYCV